MNSSATGPFRTILLTRLRFIGDVVLTTPVIAALRAAYPDARLTYMGEQEAVRLLEGNPHLDEIIGIGIGDTPVWRQLALFARLARKRFDLVIDLFGNPRSALLCRATGARVRVGPDRRSRAWLYTVKVHDDGRPKSAIDFHYQSLAAVGIPAGGHATHLYLSDRELDEADRLLASLGVDRKRPVVCLHPGATWPAKRWPAERFGRLAERLHTGENATVIVSGGPGDAQSVQGLAKAASVPVTILPLLDLRRLAAVIARCKVFVTNDCGPMHIAVAVGTSTVGIFGPGEENIWFPYTSAFPDGSDRHIALRKDVPCHPCHLDICNRTGSGYMECMNLLGVEEVFRATAERLR